MNIFLAPVKFSNALLLGDLASELAKRFSSKISIIGLEIDLEKYLSKERRQYFSTMIIADTIYITKQYDGKIILITDVDLFVPVLTFVFGEAQLSGKHSIVSACRLHEEFYSGKSDDKILFDRIIKELLHELGHNYGLRHCANWDCVMHSSPGIEQVDIKGNSYCDKCSLSVEDYKYFKF